MERKFDGMNVNVTMLPLLAVALLIWAGVYAFLFVVERKVVSLERKIVELQDRAKGAQL